jgi:hypothetical protein
MKKLVVIAMLVVSLVGGAGQASADPFGIGDGVSWEDGGLFGGVAPE